MRIGVIGTGAIGTYVRQSLAQRGLDPEVLLVRPARLAQAAPEGPAHVSRVADLPGALDLMVDCAGHSGLADHGAGILARGMDLITLSLGALADDALRARLDAAAREGNARLILASGAIGALDCLGAARIGGLSRVAYIGRKPPGGWAGSPAETRLDLARLTAPAVHFNGSARRAAWEYPKNANVAAAVALAGCGFDTTDVTLIADPDATGNTHEIHAEGDFGQFSFSLTGAALPDNPRSSALAAMSAVRAAERQRDRIVI